MSDEDLINEIIRSLVDPDTGLSREDMLISSPNVDRFDVSIDFSSPEHAARPTFDTSEEDFNEDLTAEHRYLGDNLESVSGRTFYPDGSKVTIPVITRPYGTLVPGQTFPMRVGDSTRLNLFRKCIQNDRTFGCLGLKVYYTGSLTAAQEYGTTAEIYAYSDEFNTLSIKARARQRFRVSRLYRSPDGYLMGDVEILPEIELSRPLKNFMSNAPGKDSSSITKKRHIHMGAMATRWPVWVYDQYDIVKLTDRVDKELGFLQEGIRKEKGKLARPKTAAELSYWIGSYLDADERHWLIQLNSSIERIRWELSVIKRSQLYGCAKCHSPICNAKDLFSMSVEGPQSTFVNPAGVIHDTVTFKKANNLILTTQPSPLFSWFPGYEWSIAECSNCRCHIGWAFMATNSRYSPNIFWGLSRRNLFLSAEGETLTE